MPSLYLFQRPMKIGSDDLVFPGIAEILVRIAWLIAISVIFHINKDAFACDEADLLRIFHIGVLTILCITIVITGIIIYTSMQGSITNTRARRHIPLLLYIKILSALPELAWNILGSYWAFGKSYGCDWKIVWLVKGVVIFGWLAIVVILMTLLVLFNPKINDKADEVDAAGHLEGSDGQQLASHAKSAATRIWENRCKLLCCCVSCDESHRAAFTEIAQLVSNYFSGIDLVATDIAAGLVLIQQQQKQGNDELVMLLTDPIAEFAVSHNSEHSSGASNHESLKEHVAPAPWMRPDLMEHYMRYATASYGWPFYMFTHLCTGCCLLFPHCRCCNCSAMYTEVDNDNPCHCHTAAIKRITHINSEDLIYASFHNKIYEIPFFVAIDRRENAVVIAIRGTLSLKDAVTDMTADCDCLNIEGLSDCQAHKGILRSALFIKAKLERQNMLEKAFQRGHNLQLVITGHSLGAGAAALLAMLLRPQYPNLICFAFSPPGGLLSLSASQHTREYICSVILGQDLVPRLGIATMEDLKTKLLQAIHECSSPKYQVLMGGCWQVTCGVSANQGQDNNDSLNQPLCQESSSSQYSAINVDLEQALREALHTSGHTDLTSDTSHTRLYPPGQILHIVEVEASRSWFGSPQYRAVWSEAENFTEIKVSPRMLTDHIPDTVLQSLEILNKHSITPTMCMEPGGNLRFV